MATNHDDDMMSNENLALATSLAYAADQVVRAAIAPVEDAPPGLSLQERGARTKDFLRNLQYRDGQIDISMGIAFDEAGHALWHVSVFPCDESGERRGLVAFLPHDDEATPLIASFKPGPWCTHVLTVAQRAQRVLDDRQAPE